MNPNAPTLLFLSPTPVFDMQGKSGKEVVSLSLHALSEYFKLELLAPGLDPQIKNLRFHPLRASWFQRMKSVPLLGHLFNYFYFAYLWWTVRSIVKKQQIRPDVIYMAGPWMSLIGSTVIRKKKTLQVNRYYGIHNTLYYRSSLKNRIRYALKIIGYKKVGDLVIITNDGTQGDELLRRLGCDPNKIRFWTNGVNILNKAVSREESRNMILQRWGLNPHIKILLTVSRLAGGKRVDRAINLLADIQTFHPDAILIIAGDGEQKNALVQLVRKKGLTGHVLFAGSLSREDLNLVYPASDVFISLYEDSNAGNPLFESMIHGCCIYTYGRPEVREYLDDASAVLVKPGEPDAGALAGILNDPEKRIALGKKARERALEKLQSWDERINMEVQEILHAMQEKIAGKP